MQLWRPPRRSQVIVTGQISRSTCLRSMLDRPLLRLLRLTRCLLRLGRRLVSAGCRQCRVDRRHALAWRVCTCCPMRCCWCWRGYRRRHCIMLTVLRYGLILSSCSRPLITLRVRMLILLVRRRVIAMAGRVNRQISPRMSIMSIVSSMYWMAWRVVIRPVLIVNRLLRGMSVHWVRRCTMSRSIRRRWVSVISCLLQRCTRRLWVLC